jgi:nucleoside 2-deoxyribosyltransferase
MDKCRFCDSDVSFKYKNDGEITVVTCPRCGKYEIIGTGLSMLTATTFNRVIVSGWIREQNAAGITPSFDSRNVRQLETLRKPSLKERTERYLLAVAGQCPELGADFDPFAEHLIGASYSSGPHELEILVNYLVEQKLLWNRLPRSYWLNPKGHIAADDLRSKRAKSTQGFVAMWFSPDMKPIYDEGLRIGIENAGYKSMRVDQKEHANKIDDEIIAEIRRSAFLVADFTGHRGGVYFEAGFAMGLGLPVIWTCRKDNIKDLHFDIRQYNCIDWTEADELAKRLRQRIEAMLGRGPVTMHQQVGVC